MSVDESSSASKLLITAVICTYNRAPFLQQALGALCGQSLGKDRFEVVVVDDGSTDDTRERIAGFEGLLNLRYTYQANSGLASGKNHGLLLARAAIVAFLDDDDILDSRCLEEHYLSHQTFPELGYAVLGYTGLAWQAKQSPLMRYVTEVGCQLFSYPRIEHESILDFTYFWGGRSSCKREFLLEHGLFNPVFRFGAEDIELGYRLHRVGLQVVYNARAVSHMLRTLEFDEFCRRCYLQGRSNWIFSELHPEPDVRAWAQIDDAERSWDLIEPRFDEIMGAGRGLDRFAQERARFDLPLDELSTKLLHRGYAMAFSANRIRGSVDRMREDRAAESQIRQPGRELLFGEPNPQSALCEEGLAIQSFPCLEAYRAFQSRTQKETLQRRWYEGAIVADMSPRMIDGFCHVCAQSVRFQVDFKHAYLVDGKPTPNWRETLICSACGLNNRMRAAIFLFKQELKPARTSRVYVTEQTTALFKRLGTDYPDVVGSEFLDDTCPPGTINVNGIRHEDATRLSFQDNSFDHVLSFDVLEHIPNYGAALVEFHRVLRPGGSMLLSVPFLPDAAETLVRAQVDARGDIVHFTEPEYHGDPIRSGGCLSFYHFGWTLLADLSAAGFVESRVITYWSRHFGYLGADQIMFHAVRN
jgi:GT2 family glycosyltransferase/SAM-dependent methyltransferase